MGTIEKRNLSYADTTRIKKELQISSLLWVGYILVILLLSALVYLIAVGFFTPVDGFESRGLLAIVMFLLPVSMGIWHAAIGFLDLYRGEKMLIRSTDYVISEIKHNTYLVIKDVKCSKVPVYKGMVPMIDIDKPIEIEIARFSKILLSVSDGTCNLLDKFEADDLKSSRK